MTRSGRLTQWRDELICAMIPSVHGALPGMSTVDLSSFWTRFDRIAPWHLRAGLRVAVLALALLLPVMMFGFRTISRLTPDERDHLLVRAQQLPIFASLVEIVKVVACLGYFDDPRVIEAARRLT